MWDGNCLWGRWGGWGAEVGVGIGWGADTGMGSGCGVAAIPDAPRTGTALWDLRPQYRRDPHSAPRGLQPPTPPPRTPSPPTCLLANTNSTASRSSSSANIRISSSRASFTRSRSLLSTTKISPGGH